MTCDLCDAPATVHLTEIINGHKSNRHLCDTHAQQVIPGHDPARRDRTIIERHRALIAFIEKHNRLPSQEDSIRLGFRFASSGGADPAAGMLSFLRRFVNFYEKHGRMPQGNELDESNP